MHIKNISLTNFRNHKSLHLQFGEGINFLCGQNAKGKTNVLEAIYYFATTKSFRTSKDILAIEENSQNAFVSMEIQKNFGSQTLEMELLKPHKKTFFKNGEKMHSPSKILGNFCAVLFSPDEMKIAKGGPEERRDFLDSAICELSSAYFDLLSRYEKVLFSRNLLLKRHADDAEIDVFDSQLAALASKIINQRTQFVLRLAPVANQIMNFLSAGKENLQVKYETAFAKDFSPSTITDSLGANRMRDKEVGYTTLGPHRDDLALVSNKKDLRTFGSQGQQRTAVLALKLAVYEVFTNALGEAPVLLLDDVFSELDATRAKLLFEKVKLGQTIITGTRLRSCNFEYKKLKL